MIKPRESIYGKCNLDFKLHRSMSSEFDDAHF
jgi:hypothetical protein